MTNGERISAFDSLRKMTHGERTRALDSIRKKSEIELLREERSLQIKRGVLAGLCAVILAVMIVIAALFVGWTLYAHSYSASERAVMKQCRDRGDVPVVYHARSGEVLGISCDSERWKEHIERTG